MTPEQLRELADRLDNILPFAEDQVSHTAYSSQLRAHASTLKRLAERDIDLKAASDAWHAQEEELQRLREELARIKGQLVEQKAIIEALMAGSMVASDEGVIPVIRRIELLQEQLALAYDAINDALPWMIKLGDYIGNGTQADPMGRCNAILKMRIAVEKRDD